MFNRTNSGNTTSAISSAASAAGRSRCDLPAQMMLPGFGPEAVRANPIHPPAKDSVTPIRETSGRSSSASSASADLSELLVNKLRQRLSTVGSMEYRQTWKRKTTPLGRSYWAHTASVRRTSDSDCTGWPTPQRSDEVEGARTVPDSKQVCPGRELNRIIAGWPTCTVGDSANARNATANRSDLDSQHHAGTTLVDAVELAGWATPNLSDWKAGTTEGRQQKSLGQDASRSSAETASCAGLVLNPAMSRWLQGYPPSWDRNSPGWQEWQSLQDAIALAG